MRVMVSLTGSLFAFYVYFVVYLRFSGLMLEIQRLIIPLHQ